MPASYHMAWEHMCTVLHAKGSLENEGAYKVVKWLMTEQSMLLSLGSTPCSLRVHSHLLYTLNVARDCGSFLHSLVGGFAEACSNALT